MTLISNLLTLSPHVQKALLLGDLHLRAADQGKRVRSSSTCRRREGRDDHIRAPGRESSYISAWNRIRSDSNGFSLEFVRKILPPQPK